jgi:lysophospholipase L1-like esterase
VQGIAALVDTIRKAPIEPDIPVPPVLVVAPPPIQTPRGPIAWKFLGGDAKCAGFAEALQEVATALGCFFFDARTVISSSKVDGVHLDADQHLALGHALSEVVRSILPGPDHLNR